MKYQRKIGNVFVSFYADLSWFSLFYPWHLFNEDSVVDSEWPYKMHTNRKWGHRNCKCLVICLENMEINFNLFWICFWDEEHFCITSNIFASIETDFKSKILENINKPQNNWESKFLKGNDHKKIIFKHNWSIINK